MCVCVCAGKETVVLLSPEQAALRLSKFPLANNNSPKVPIEARLGTATHPAQYVGVGVKETVYGYSMLSKYKLVRVSNESHRRVLARFGEVVPLPSRTCFPWSVFHPYLLYLHLARPAAELESVFHSGQ